MAYSAGQVAASWRWPMPDLNYLARSACRSDKCGYCGGFKRHQSIFCYSCWSVLPKDVAVWAKRHWGSMKTREGVYTCLWGWLIKLRPNPKAPPSSTTIGTNNSGPSDPRLYRGQVPLTRPVPFTSATGQQNEGQHANRSYR